MIELLRRAYSFIKNGLSCCDKKSTAVSPAVMQGTKHLSNNSVKILSDNFFTCTCCAFNWERKKKRGRRKKGKPPKRSVRRGRFCKNTSSCAMWRQDLHRSLTLGGGEELISKRTPNSESSFHSALTKFYSPPNSSPSPLIASNSPAHTAFLRQLGEAVQGTIGLGAPKGPPLGSIIQKGKPDSTSLVGKGPGDQLINNVSLLIPKLIPPLVIGSILWEQSSAGEIFRCIVDYDMSTLTTIEPIKVDLEALAQAQKVGEAGGSMQGSAPAERAALEMEIEQQVSCPHKMKLRCGQRVSSLL